ncbi:MAG: hypothetical protein N2645_02235 [Clostridia bacterium]|nr:hypothetical protein [Clostridia bacterium]
MKETNFIALEFYEKLDLLVKSDEIDEGEIRNCIETMLLPSLEIGYQNGKEFLKASSRGRIYNVKKALIDLLEGNEAIKVHRLKDDEIRAESKFGSLFIMLQFLAGVYSFAVLLRNKIQNSRMHNPMLMKLSAIIRDVKSLEDEIQSIMEMRATPML